MGKNSAQGGSFFRLKPSCEGDALTVPGQNEVRTGDEERAYHVADSPCRAAKSSSAESQADRSIRHHRQERREASHPRKWKVELKGPRSDDRREIAAAQQQDDYGECVKQTGKSFAARGGQRVSS